MTKPNHAVIAAALSALAGTASAGHKIEIDSGNIDADLAQDIKNYLSKSDFMRDVDADYSVFEGELLVDGDEVEVDPSLIMATYVKTEVAPDQYLGKDRNLDGTSVVPVDSIIDCYDACHTNCHGSRSWR